MTPLVGVDHRHLARSMKGLMRLSSREQANSSPAIIRLNWHSDLGGKPESSPKGLFPLSNIRWQYVERLLNHVAAFFAIPEATIPLSPVENGEAVQGKMEEKLGMRLRTCIYGISDKKS